MGCIASNNDLSEMIESIQILIQEINKDLVSYCVNEYCCRIIQRMFEFCNHEYLEESSQIIMANYAYLSQNEFGIFVLSSILEHGHSNYKS